LEKLLFAQCGPIRHTLVDAPTAEVRTVKVRRTSVSLPADIGQRPPIHIIWEGLVQDQGRIAVIVADLLSCVATGRSPLVLADRKVYLDRLQQAFSAQASHVICHRLDAQLGKRARSEILRQIDAHYSAGTPFVLFATASLIGEGFDLPRLDTLILAMPLSWKGRLVQYAGRLHRIHEAKGAPIIYDYVDEDHALTNAMFRRRLAGYKELGYVVEMPQIATPIWFGDNPGETEIAQ
jgi:superfamily II DNA or RNA helicase